YNRRVSFQCWDRRNRQLCGDRIMGWDMGVLGHRTRSQSDLENNFPHFPARTCAKPGNDGDCGMLAVLLGSDDIFISDVTKCGSTYALACSPSHEVFDFG